MTITTSQPNAAAGVSAVLSGLLYIVDQPIRPKNVATVTGTARAVVDE